LQELLPATLSFLQSFAASHRDNVLVIIGVAGSQVSILYPRKDSMTTVISALGTQGGSRVDPLRMRDGLMFGAAELMNKCIQGQRNKHTSITAAVSLALCVINRFMKTFDNGFESSDGNSSLLHRREDEGILGMISKKIAKEGEGAAKLATAQRLAQRRARGMLSPRIMIVQASDDHTPDYNAFMNCVFAANKRDIVIDGCFIPGAAESDKDKSSTFLEQACDRTAGVFSRPVGMSQIGGGLTEIFMTVFLPPLGLRDSLNLPKVNKVDFRARCFESGQSVEIGFICNLCLSIFKHVPNTGVCLTCGAKILDNTNQKQLKINSGNENNGQSIGSKRSRLE
jgi:transcription initiation factor TFIIH subunit 3